MQHSVQSGNGRSAQRVPLDALIELRSEDGDEVLEADGLDVSPGGVSMRASFVPPVGARLNCQFRCPPAGDAVRAEGEVVWSHWSGPHDGAFGMRFLELDTTSATAIRRYVEPDAAPLDEHDAARMATLRIDGVGTPIEADVRLSEQGSLVLEQELTFLKLGRGVSIDLVDPTRGGPARGRIASVELRHGPLDVPTLVFGILLDEARPAAQHASASAADAASFATLRAASPSRVAASARGAEATPAEAAPVFPAPEARESSAPVQATRAVRPNPRQADEPRVVCAPEADELPEVLPPAPGLATALAQLASFWASLRERIMLTLGTLRRLITASGAGVSERHWPNLRERVAAELARVRGWFAMQGGRFRAFRKARQDRKRRSTAPVLRVQKAGAARAGEPNARPAPPKNRRLAALSLGVIGIGLGVYALAPRSEAGRIRVRQPIATLTEEAAPAPAVVPPESVQPPTLTAPLVSAPAAKPAATEPVATGSLTFGEASVPNGRTFVLRMSGPVEGVEGERRDDGFTVRVPGRLALDRASPIATSHRAVQRAMILNRGDYAELTVDFLPGLRPKYQVVGKEATLEVTLERL